MTLNEWIEQNVRATGGPKKLIERLRADHQFELSAGTLNQWRYGSRPSMNGLQVLFIAFGTPHDERLEITRLWEVS
jgi:hypothetical protein